MFYEIVERFQKKMKTKLFIYAFVRTNRQRDKQTDTKSIKQTYSDGVIYVKVNGCAGARAHTLRHTWSYSVSVDYCHSRTEGLLPEE